MSRGAAVLDRIQPTEPPVTVAPRVDQPGFTYRGRGDAHLVGQPCRVVVGASVGSSTCLVVFACGCRAAVPYTALEPA
jgi:hypothetical protein